MSNNCVYYSAFINGIQECYICLDWATMLNLFILLKEGIAMFKKTNVLRLSLSLLVVLLLFFGFLIGIQFFTAEVEILFVQYLLAAVLWIDMILGLLIIFSLFQMLSLIDKDKIFTTLALSIMTRIQNLILSIAVISLGLMPFFVTVAHLDDAPGFVLFGIGILFIPFAIYFLVLVLKDILIKAINLQ